MSRAGLEVAGSYPAPPSTASGLRRLPRGTPQTGHLPPRQTRRCRRRFRTTTTVRTRTPSLGSTRALRPERARLCSLFTCTASPRTLSLAASLGLPRQRPAGRLELSRSFTRLVRACAKGPERCVSPRSATDSRHEHPADCSVPGCVRCHAPPRGVSWRPACLAARGDETLAHPGPWPGGGEAREPAHLHRLPDEPTKWSFA